MCIFIDLSRVDACKIGQYKKDYGESIYRTRAIISRSWLEAAVEYKPYIRTEFSEKNLLKNKEMVFENGVKKKAAAYNGARTVYVLST